MIDMTSDNQGSIPAAVDAVPTINPNGIKPTMDGKLSLAPERKA
jgi:hypothetical protein